MGDEHIYQPTSLKLFLCHETFDVVCFVSILFGTSFFVQKPLGERKNLQKEKLSSISNIYNVQTFLDVSDNPNQSFRIIDCIEFNQYN